MAVVQSTYLRNIPIGTPGMPASMTGWAADSKLVETAAGIAFGIAVARGSADRGVVVGAGATVGLFVGITYRDNTLVSSAADKYLQRQLAGIMIRGDIWVTAIAAVTPADPVRADPATGTLGVAAGTGIVTLPNARWMTSAGAGGLAILRLNVPGNPSSVQ